MQETEQQDEIERIRSLRAQGLLTPQEAYERHMALLGAARMPAPVALAPSPPSRPSTAAGMIALQLLALTLAVLGGVFGIVGAISQEVRAGGGVMLAFAAAPLIEEALKPAGIYVLLIRWPQALLGRLHTATLTAISGLCFGLIESYVYVHVYNAGGSADYRLFRYTVPVAMHVIGSFVVGLGLNRSLIDWAAGRTGLSKSTRNFYLAGVLLHITY
ncbi:MAG TPA: PrsW family glutamic-type intramembrane protease, partial [Dehalococcoidia bacterium]|nr:PrsW family glutamic-type intramembrane protease [Dehalococcoidia bacterium]